MQPVTRSEILGLGDYEQIRAHFRARVIESKRDRRLRIADFMSATFENHDTVLLQIQEMLRTERITQEKAILHEIETYNELVPGADELSFTLFIEVSDKATREQKLEELAGLETSVSIEVLGQRFAATSKDRSVEGIARTTAVHYFKATLGAEASRSMAEGKPAALVVDHPACKLHVPFPPPLSRSLAADFANS